MTDQQQQMLYALNDLSLTTQILMDALSNNDSDKSHEAVSVLLMQGLGHLGADSPAMQQFFPVFDNIKRYIDTDDLATALGQTRIFERQLKEIVEIVRNSG